MQSAKGLVVSLALNESELFDICRACQYHYVDDMKICEPCDVFKQLKAIGDEELKLIQENRIKRGIPLDGIVYHSEVTKHSYDKKAIQEMFEFELSNSTISRISGKHVSTIRYLRNEYSKHKQLAKVKVRRIAKRNSINKKEYQKMVDAFGTECYFCKREGHEAHHVKYRSQGGRGVWRNLRMLCMTCHDDLHKYEIMKIELQDEHERLFGKYYFMDCFDLYKNGLIAEQEENLLEKYFTQETTL